MMDLKAQIQAFLFYYGDSISKKKLAKHLSIEESDCDAALQILSKELEDNPHSGLVILEQNNEVQLATKPNLKSLADKLVQDEFKEELTPAALETLSIIAYLGPVPRSSVDYIRGVNSSFIIRALLMRGLVARDEEKSKGNTYFYSVSFDFLKHLALTKRDELPEFEKYKNMLTSFEVQSLEVGEATSTTSLESNSTS